MKSASEAGVQLLVHTDARQAKGEFYTLEFQSGRRLETHPTGSRVTDPEDIAVDNAADPAIVYLGDIGDNQGGGRCLQYERSGEWPDGTARCRVTGARPESSSKTSCKGIENGLWVKKSVDRGRTEPYRIHRLPAPKKQPGPTEPGASLSWRRYPHDESGRCAGTPCRVFPSVDTDADRLGQFNAEALFLRRERSGQKTSLSAYIVTKAPLPLETELERQRETRCRFEEDGRAVVFRLPGVDALPSGDVRSRLEAVATLNLGTAGLNPGGDSRLSLRITAAAFDGVDLVVTTRGAAYRWLVPESQPLLDQTFFDTHRPCSVALPPLADAPKIEGLALADITPGGQRSYYVVSEEGDRYEHGEQSIYRLTQQWSYSPD